MSAVVRTNSTSVYDPPGRPIPVFMGYCGVHSADFGAIWAGDLGRSAAAAPTALAPRRTDCGVLGERAQIGLACAAGRVNVGGLDSWLAPVEQPPRIDEAPETAGHSQDVPERFAPALEKTKKPHLSHERGCCPDVAVGLPPICLRVSSLVSSLS